MEIKRHKNILQKNSTALLVIDIQERIINVMDEHDRVVANAKKLIEGFNILELPVYTTEQYPKGLGSTVNELSELLIEKPIEKITFSCYGANSLFESLKEKKVTQIVVCGVESHVCVQQTVLDLLANGFDVFVAADAISSRRKMDYNIALDRMRSNSAEVTTTESILFELLERAGSDQFKKISKIVK